MTVTAPAEWSTAPSPEPGVSDHVCTLADVRDLAVLPIWTECGPSVAALLGLSRSSAYAAAKSGHVPTIRIGSKVVCPVPALRRLLGDLADAPAAAAPAVAVHDRVPDVDHEPPAGGVDALMAALRTSTPD